jgi:hypothetical protein
MITALINHTKACAHRTWRTVRITRRIAADASLLLVLFVSWQAAHGKIVQFDGVAHAEMPFGNPQQAMIAQLPADQVLPASFVMPENKPAKVADAPLPQRKPEPPKAR